MKFFFGLLVGLALAVGVALSAAYVECDGDLKNGCDGKNFHIKFDDKD